MTRVLRLNEDQLPASGEPVYLPALDRALYVLAGEVTVEFARGCSRHSTGSAWLGGEEIALLPSPEGARVLRWELATGPVSGYDRLPAAPGVATELKLSAEVDLDPRFGWLMRCDRVAFPKAGIAYRHVHQGPGIRYCLEGQIQIETEGLTQRYGPGEAWFESGTSPVRAPTSQDAETAFVRCFVLPRSCKGRSSIRYVEPEDASKPKLQRYAVLGERFIDMAGN